MRALVVTNMYPSPARPALGSFVRDQVRELQKLDGFDVQVHAFDPGGVRAYPAAWRRLRNHYAGQTFDVVHAHFGLTAWPALAVKARHRLVTLHGNDLYHPRSRPITTAVLPRMDLVGTPTAVFAAEVPGSDGKRPVAILPCGLDMERFRPIDRAAARAELGLKPDGRYLLFPYAPDRPVKRLDLAQELARATDAELLTLGATPPEQMPLWMNAANVVLTLADWETLGLACLEALACDVPVLARPTGAHPDALADVPGTLCADWDLEAFAAVARPHLDDPDPRVDGRSVAERWSARALAERVAGAWLWLDGRGPKPPLYSPALVS